MISLSDRVLNNGGEQFVRRKKPAWLRAKLPSGPGYQQLRELVDRHRLHTVCESAMCPNMGECWAHGTATIMILGDVCTRSCGFCHIKTGRPPELDLDEPRRVGEAAALMKLKHMVVTSVNRDELPDGGASIWAQTIRQVRQQSPGTSIEVLIPDFCGDWDALQLVLDERPDILNHNLETVSRLYPAVRPQAKFARSIELLRRAKEQGLIAKTGIMVGIGEEDAEVHELMHQLVEGTRVSLGGQTSVKPPSVPATQGGSGSDAWREGDGGGCDVLTIGQYLQPTPRHLPVNRWVTPQQFAAFKEYGQSLGLKHVESGPLVRSSYHAAEQVEKLPD